MTILHPARQGAGAAEVRCPSASGRSKLDMMGPRRTDDPAIAYSRSRAHYRLVALAVVLFGVIGAFWIAATPEGTFAEGISQTLQYLVSPWMLATEAITVSFLAYGAIFLRSSPWKAREATTVEGLLRRQRLRLLLVVGLFTLGMLGIGALFAYNLQRDAYQQTLVQTETIARLKAQQVDNWLYERSIDAERAGSALRQLPFDQWSSDGEIRQIAGVLLSEILAGHPERVSVALYSSGGKLLLKLGQETTTDEKAIDAGSRKSGLEITDIALGDGALSKPGMSFVLPIRKAGADATAAILALTVDPAPGVLNQVRDWPTPSVSGEVLLVRRNGDEVVYVTPPRSLGQAAAASEALHLPLATKGRPAAKALLRGDGVHEGRDYRGVDVIAASAAVHGIAWRVIAKIDRDEAMTAAHRKSRALAVVVLGAILSAWLMSAILWRGQRAGMLAYRRQQDAHRRALVRHCNIMFATVRDAVFLIDSQSNILEANPAAVNRYGYSLAEFRKMNGRDLREPTAKAEFESQGRPAPEELGHIYQTIHRRKDGTTFPVEIAHNAFVCGGVTYFQGFVRDISDR